MWSWNLITMLPAISQNPMVNSGLNWEKITLRLRNPFRLSYGTSEERQAFWLQLPGDAGWGEGTIPPYYGVEAKTMEDYWRGLSRLTTPLPETVDEIPAWMGKDGPAPARCAIDLAMHDHLAKSAALPLYAYLGLPDPEPKPSSVTIALDTPVRMGEIALEVGKYPIIKVKLGGDDRDLERLDAVRAARPDVRLWVDANAGWDLDSALQYLPALEDLRVELLEQPLSKVDFSGMGQLQSKTSIAVVADESVQSLADVEALAAAGLGGVNIKLMKVGGLGPALEMIRRARALGLGVMLGCMIETSLGTTAMAHLSGLADWLDLDASLLITNDPFEGMRLDETCMVRMPERPGIGVRLVQKQ